MNRYPSWLTPGQAQHMRRLEEAGWTFSLGLPGEDPDFLDVIHGIRVKHVGLVEDTLLLWKDDEAMSMLHRWSLGEGPHRHPGRIPPDIPKAKKFGSRDRSPH